MSPQSHDSPYREGPTAKAPAAKAPAAGQHDAPQASRGRGAPRGTARRDEPTAPQRAGQSESPSRRGGRGRGSGASAAKQTPTRGASAARESLPSRNGRHVEHAQAAHAARKVTHAPSGRTSTTTAKSASRALGAARKERSSRSRGGRRGRSGSPYAGPMQLTSHPTGRAAYVETRSWLLERHGPVCAYCSRTFEPGAMTLDHVAPRRGQTAYDRRDNLVLACQTCNAAKRDLPPLAFLLGNRTRAESLLRYGDHLSHGLLELARSLVVSGAAAPAPPPAAVPAAPAPRKKKIRFADEDDGASPYKD